jgi:zinc protease
MNNINMKIKFFLPSVIIAFAFSFVGLNKNNSYADSGLRIDNLDLPKVSSVTLKNGLKIFQIADELPRLTITLSAGFGRLYETNSNAGISDMAAKVLSLAGSKKYPADVLHNTIESIGGKFAIESSYEETIIIIEVLDKYSDLAFDILEDIVKNPNLDEKIIEKARSLLLEDERRKVDNPDALAFEKAREIIFSGSGYGAVVSAKSLKAITKSDIENVLNNYFTADNMLMGISSSLDIKEIEKYTAAFSTLKKTPENINKDYNTDIKAISASITEKSKNIYLLPKNIPQATIVAGTLAPDIKNSGMYSLTLMNDILGGSDFNSRLMLEIREKRGLAYSVQSVTRFRKKTGVFLAFAQTKNETADTSLSLLLENIDQISKSDVKDHEIKLAKDSIKNSYIFEFDSPINILKKYSFLSYNELPDSFFLDYLARIDKVTPEDIRKNTARMLTNGLIKVVVGKKELESKLSRFGKVVVIGE